MAVTFGFYNSLDGDRMYDAEQISSIFDGVIRDGVFMYSNGNDLPFTPKVLPSVPMSITMDPGRCWFDHTWTLSNNLETFAFEPGEAYGRYDAVVLDVNRTIEARQNSFYVVKGEARPTPVWPTMINEGDRRQYPFIYVYIPASATTLRTQDIEYHIGRDPGDVPFVTCPLEILDPSELFAKWDEIWAEWYADVQTEWTDFVGNRLTEFNNFIIARQNEWDTWLSMRQDDFDAWLSARNVIFNNWFSQIQSDWMTWFDASKADFDGFKGDYNNWWTSAEEEFRDWLEGIQGLINGDEFNELVQGINDVNGLFDATYVNESGVPYVDISIPTNPGSPLYRNIKKSPENVAYTFSFVAPRAFDVGDTYRFTDAINGVNKLVMNIKNSAGYHVLSPLQWEAGAVVQIARNGNKFAYIGDTKPNQSFVIGSSVANTTVYQKLCRIDTSSVPSNSNFTLSFIVSPTYLWSGTSAMGSGLGQSRGYLHLRKDDDATITRSSSLFIDGGTDIVTPPGPGFYIFATNLGDGIVEIGAMISDQYMGIMFTEVALGGRRMGLTTNPVRFAKVTYYYTESANELNPPTGTAIASKYLGAQYKVDKVTPGAEGSYAYGVQRLSDGSIIDNIRQFTSSNLPNTIVNRNALNTFGIGPAHAADQPARYDQLTSAVQGALDVEEFYRIRRRVAGAPGVADAHWVNLGTIERLPTDDTTNQYSVAIRLSASSESRSVWALRGGFAVDLTATVGYNANGTVSSSDTAIKVNACNSQPGNWLPYNDIQLRYANNSTTAPALWMKIPTNAMRMDVIIMDEFTANVALSNSRSDQIFEWGSPNTSSGSGIVDTARPISAPVYVVTPQMYSVPGWWGDGYSGANTWTGLKSGGHRLYATVTGTGMNAVTEIFWSGMPNAPVWLSVGITSNANNDRQGTVTATIPVPTGIREKCYMAPCAIGTQFDYYYAGTSGVYNNVQLTTSALGISILGTDSWLRVNSSVTYNGDNMAAWLSGINSIHARVQYSLAAEATSGTYGVLRVPIATWGQAGRMLGLYFG